MTGVRRIIGTALLMTAVLGGGQALAADEPTKHAAPAAGEAAPAPHGEKAEGEHVNSPFSAPAPWDLGLWSIAVFVLLFLILGKFAWPPMLEGLKKREENIRSAQLEAEKSREESKQAQIRLEQKMKELDEKVRLMHEEARKAAEQTKAQILADAHAQIKLDREKLQQEFVSERAAARKELLGQMVDLSTQITAKILRRSLTPEDQQRLVDEALTEIKGAGDARKSELASSQL